MASFNDILFMFSIIDMKISSLTYLGHRLCDYVLELELVSKELNHFGVIAGLFRQIWVIVVDLRYFALFEDFSL